MNTTDRMLAHLQPSPWVRRHVTNRQNPEELERLADALLLAQQACEDWQDRFGTECACEMCRDVAGILWSLHNARGCLNGTMLATRKTVERDAREWGRAPDERLLAEMDRRATPPGAPR